MIAVCIATYNQEAFIAQAVASVQAQVCEEEIRIYIGDDASTDGTEAICRGLAKADERIVYVRQKKNRGLVANTIDLYRRIIADGAAFIAMLDGDDYWTDSRKFQKQMDYLQAHPETGLVHTAVEGQKDETFPTGDLRERYDLTGARQTNCTVVFRTELLDENELHEIEQARFPVLDYPLYGLFSQKTLFGYIDQPTAVWRSHESVSQAGSAKARLRYRKERIRMWHWLDKKYPNRFHFRWDKAILWYLWQNFYFLFAQFKKMLYLCSRF